MQILRVIGRFQKNVEIMSQKGLGVHGSSILTVMSIKETLLLNTRKYILSVTNKKLTKRVQGKESLT
jgi:hypothetical protein